MSKIHIAVSQRRGVTLFGAKKPKPRMEAVYREHTYYPYHEYVQEPTYYRSLGSIDSWCRAGFARNTKMKLPKEDGLYIYNLKVRKREVAKVPK